MKNFRWKMLLGSLLGMSSLMASNAIADGSGVAYKIFGKSVSVSQVEKANQSAFYDLAKKKFDQIESTAQQAYVKEFWIREAKIRGITPEAYQDDYLKKNVNISEKEIKETLERFKDHPRLGKLPKAEQEKQVRDYLEDRDRAELINGIITQGRKAGNLVVSFPRPKEPRYDVEISKDDVHRYSAEVADNKPVKCKGDSCPITIVEFSEFQCPFCKRILPDAKRVLQTYAGRVRWIVRDFPLSFHDRAKPAAIAARCAAFQGKYWAMYEKLFVDQSKLSDADFKAHGKSIGLDMAKFEGCLKSPANANKIIDENFRSGVKVGVTGTPAFFINGRRFSGAIPFAEFQRVIEEELAKKSKS